MDRLDDELDELDDKIEGIAAASRDRHHRLLVRVEALEKRLDALCAVVEAVARNSMVPKA
jgi:archaellum component FlaC